MTTPFKALGSFGFIIGEQYGEFLVSTMNESIILLHISILPNYAFFDENRNIVQAKYDVAHTFRAGTEWKYLNLSFRGGVNYTTSPIKSTYHVQWIVITVR
jgi:long-subunit fatty acid transport protein